jgi:hypothetical protein
MTVDTRLPGWSFLRVGIDAIVHALVFVVLVVGFGAITGFARGETVVMMHNMLFLGGIALLGLGTTMFTFASPVSVSNKNKSRVHRRKQRKRLSESLDNAENDEKVKPTTSGGSLPFHKLIWLVPPLRWIQPPETADRISPAGKLVLAGVLSLGFWSLISVAKITGPVS